MCASRVSEFVTWPDDLAKTKAEFENMAGFPGVVGSVDGSRIPIPAPRDHGQRVPYTMCQRYINRKGFASMNLLAVCDSSLKFTFVHVGWPVMMMIRALGRRNKEVIWRPYRLKWKIILKHIKY